MICDRQTLMTERAIERWVLLRKIGVRIGEKFNTLIAAIAWATTRQGAQPGLTTMARLGLVTKCKAYGFWRLESRTKN